MEASRGQRRWSIYKSINAYPVAWIVRLDSNVSRIHPIIHRAFKTWTDAMEYVDARVNEYK